MFFRDLNTKTNKFYSDSDSVRWIGDKKCQNLKTF